MPDQPQALGDGAAMQQLLQRDLQHDQLDGQERLDVQLLPNLDRDAAEVCTRVGLGAVGRAA